jgi:hypothetical protein
LELTDPQWDAAALRHKRVVLFLPNYVAQAFVAGSSTSGSPGQIQTNYCWAGQNYSFSGLDGIQRILNVTNNWADVNNPNPTACTPSEYARSSQQIKHDSFTA